MNILNIGYSHPSIKLIKDLKKKNIDDKYVIEDISFFEFLMKENRKLDLFVYCPSLINKESTKAIKDYFIKNSKEVYEISEKVCLSICEKDNSACMFGVGTDKKLSISDIDPKKHKFVIVIDRLENPGNIGTIIRTMDGCKADLIISVDEIVKLNSYKVIQASRGMSLFTNKVSCSYEAAQKYLLDNNYDIYLGEPIKGKPYNEYDYSNNIAIVIGNERYGINNKWYENKHKEVFIPMVGKMTSLNVSVAGSILIYEAFMKRNRN